VVKNKKKFQGKLKKQDLSFLFDGNSAAGS
jgi:hypothetical protein